MTFLKFDTDDIEDCIDLMHKLQQRQQNLDETRKSELCVMATGGGAFKYYDEIKKRLGVDVHREDEMECLITGSSL